MYKGTLLKIANKSNVHYSKLFHIYRNGKNSISKISFLSRSSVKKLVPLRRLQFRKKARIFTLIVRTNQWISRLDGSRRKFFLNDAIILKKNANISHSFTYGSTVLELSRRKYLSFFKSYL